jgi:1-acyl-sn-glycerol-3-phosphate acyltransferase
VPSTGPALLVANHPNSLLDPALVAAAAGRPVRFVAKAPLFTDPLVGWLIRGAACIPVYRKVDDPGQTARNTEMFRAVHAAIADGAAVGIFPEGTSHSEPSLVPLKTGAARIALGAFALHGRAFPIIPVGLLFREKDVFRSEAQIVVGQPIAWDDLGPAGIDDAAAVRELTRRIDEGLRLVTVNLERWEDAPLVECAEAVYSAEFGRPSDAASRVVRMRETTELLARVRASGDERWTSLVRDVRLHARMLERLGLTPAELRTDDVDTRSAARWMIKRLWLIGTPAVVVTIIAAVIFWLPYRVTGVIERRVRPQHDVRSTHKALTGSLFFLIWIVLLASLAGWSGGVVAALLTLVALPLMGLVALEVLARWDDATVDARRFILFQRRADLVSDLGQRQRALAIRLRELRDSFPGVGAPPNALTDPGARAPR